MHTHTHIHTNTYTGPPVNLTVKAIGPNYVLLHWAPPPEASGNGIIQHYLVSFMEGNSSQTARNLTSSSSRPSMYIGYLRPSTTYICSVAAVTVLVGPFSTGLSFTTQPHSKTNNSHTHTEFHKCAVYVVRQ